MNRQPIRVTVWHEHARKQANPSAHSIYPEGMYVTIQSAIEEHFSTAATVRTAHLE